MTDEQIKRADEICDALVDLACAAGKLLWKKLSQPKQISYSDSDSIDEPEEREFYDGYGHGL